MKQYFLILMLISSIIIAGCRQTSVDGVSSSEEEAAWEATIRSNYSGYRPPRNAAPAEFDNTSTRRSAVIKKQTAPDAVPAPAAALQTAPAEETDPMVVVDNAAEVTSTNPDAPKSEVKSDAPKADIKTDDPKAEVKADVKADAPKSEAKTDVKADVKKSAAEPSEPTASTTVYVVKSGDTLGGIAQHFYGSSRYFEVITRANADLIKNPNMLKPGMKLIIPKL